MGGVDPLGRLKWLTAQRGAAFKAEAVALCETGDAAALGVPPTRGSAGAQSPAAAAVHGGVGGSGSPSPRGAVASTKRRGERPALLLVAAAGNGAAVEALLHRGADPNTGVVKTIGKSKRETALSVAAAAGAGEVVWALRVAGATDGDRTALVAALRAGVADVLEPLLCRLRADGVMAGISADDDDASGAKDVAMADVGAVADPTADARREGLLVFVNADPKVPLPVLQSLALALSSAGAWPNATNAAGRTALDEAVTEGTLSRAAALLSVPGVRVSGHALGTVARREDARLFGRLLDAATAAGAAPQQG